MAFCARLLTTLCSALREYGPLKKLRFEGLHTRSMKLSRFFLGLVLPSSVITDAAIYLGDMRGNGSGVASLSASLLGVSGVSPPDEKKSGSTLRGVRNIGGSGFSGDGGRGRLENNVVCPAAGRRLGNEDRDLEGDSNSLRGPRDVSALFCVDG